MFKMNDVLHWHKIYIFFATGDVILTSYLHACICVKTSARLFFVSESQFNYLFTLKNAHLSSSSYNFWMQPNIAMKFAGYVAWILLWKHCKFGENTYNNSRDIKFFLGDNFFWRALYIELWASKYNMSWW